MPTWTDRRRGRYRASVKAWQEEKGQVEDHRTAPEEVAERNEAKLAVSAPKVGREDRRREMGNVTLRDCCR